MVGGIQRLHDVLCGKTLDIEGVYAHEWRVRLEFLIHPSDGDKINSRSFFWSGHAD